MFDRLVIIGAGGHGKVVADIALKSGYTDVSFLDDYATGACMGCPIIGSCSAVENNHDGKTAFVLAIGNNAMRKELSERYDVPWVTLIHPSAQIGGFVRLGKGTVVMANAVINAGAVVGEHCIINSGAIVEHDNVLGDFVHISPQAALGGTVTVGAGTHVGIGAIVKNNIAICENCIIGAGAVVVKDLAESAVYVGVPAKKHE